MFAGPQANEFVEAVDILPTLADLAGLPVPPTCPKDPFNVSTDICSVSSYITWSLRILSTRSLVHFTCCMCAI